MTAFIDRLEAAGLLAPKRDAQQMAIAGLCREYQADSVTVTRLANGSRRCVFRRYDEDRPVGRAVVSKTGQVTTDVTEVIA